MDPYMTTFSSECAYLTLSSPQEGQLRQIFFYELADNETILDWQVLSFLPCAIFLRIDKKNSD